VPAAAIAGDVAGPQHGFGEGIARGGGLVGVVRPRDETHVLLHQQRTLARAAEFDEHGIDVLRAIQADVVGADGALERGDHQEFCGQRSQVDAHAAGGAVDVGDDESAGSLPGDGCDRLRGEDRRRDGKAKGTAQGKDQSTHDVLVLPGRPGAP
jgi:hypothetical protein